jgi:hypothetical protein
MSTAASHRQLRRSEALSLNAMQWAFLEALIAWARRETHGAQIISIPGGRVDPAELRQVLVALICARRHEEGTA